MNPYFLILWLLHIPALAFARDGVAPADEMSLGGIAIGQSSEDVIAQLGEPLRKTHANDFLDLHYRYPQMTVSFSDGVVAGLSSDGPMGCTPKRLCPGDSLKRMRSLYGPPTTAVLETGRFYEYYASESACWLRVRAKRKKIGAIAVICQP